MRSEASEQEIRSVLGRAASLGMAVRSFENGLAVRLVVLGGEKVPAQHFSGLPGVESISTTHKPYPLTSRESRPNDTVVFVKGVPIGGPNLCVIAGPCAIESEEMLQRI